MVSTSGVLKLLLSPAVALVRSPVRRASAIRSEMLALLQTHGGLDAVRLMQRVNFAEDTEALWYLRQDILVAVAAVLGEMNARRQLKRITALFKGCLPETMDPREFPRLQA